jgi:DNA-binding GntR family transcriptional regulator
MVPAHPGSADAACQRIRDAIVQLELPPGASVSERQLVERLGFSKAAIRAALARLRTEGLVVAEPRRGHVIAPLTMRDVLDIYDLRLAIEPRAARQAAGRIDRGEIARLQALAAPDVDVADRRSLARFLQANRTIHLAIVEAADNRRAYRIVERLLDDSERAQVVALRGGAAGHGARARSELQDVLSALEHDDGDAAERLMASAIGAFRDDLVAALQTAAMDMPLGGNADGRA